MRRAHVVTVGKAMNPIDIFKLAMSALEIALKIADLAAEVQRARGGRP